MVVNCLKMTKLTQHTALLLRWLGYWQLYLFGGKIQDPPIVQAIVDD